MKRSKKIGFSLLGLAIVALSIWVATRWGKWFGNPPEAPYVTAAAPHRVLLTFGNTGALSRIVSWTAGEQLGEAFVELIDCQTYEGALCIPAAGEVFESRSGRGAYYHVPLDNLHAGHTYRYRAVTNGHSSPWHTFTVPPTSQRSKSDFAFLYFGDVQDSIGGQCSRYVMGAYAAHPEVELAILGGDLIERPTDAYWQEGFRSLDTLAQSIPVLAVPGNHEYLKKPIRELERRYTLSFPYFLDSKVDDNHVFSLPYRDAQFYLLDSNRELPYLLTQHDWLESALGRSQARWNIVVMHHPVYSIKGSGNNLMQRLVFADLLNHNADLVLQGHEHAYARMTQHGENGQPLPPIYTVSHASPKHYRIEFDERFDRFGTGHAYYQYVRIHGDTLTMRTYDAATQQLYDDVSIVKGEHDRPTILDRAAGIAEQLDFTPQPGNKKDAAFAQRIKAYQQQKRAKK